jgi:hypothetical protein
LQAARAKTFFVAGGSIGDYEFKAALTVGQPDAMPNGFGQECHPIDWRLRKYDRGRRLQLVGRCEPLAPRSDPVLQRQPAFLRIIT